MEALKGPLWEFGRNRVKAVGGNPGILIDSANTHTPSALEGAQCWPTCVKSCPRGLIILWTVGMLSTRHRGLDRNMVEGHCLVPAASICSRGEITYTAKHPDRICRERSQQGHHCHCLCASGVIPSPLHPWDNCLGKDSPRPTENKITRGG